MDLHAALEIIRRLLNNDGGVDMTDEQIVNAINSAVADGTAIASIRTTASQDQVKK